MCHLSARYENVNFLRLNIITIRHPLFEMGTASSKIDVSSLQSIMSNLNTSCGSTLTSNQKATCNLTIDNGCPNMRYACGNDARSLFSCNMSQISSAIAKSSQTSSAMASAGFVGGADTSIKQLSESQIETFLNQTCQKGAKYNQTLYSSITCKAANATVQLGNTVNDQVACALTQVQSAIQSSSQTASGKASGVDLGQILGIVFGIVGAIIVLVLIVWFTNNVKLKGYIDISKRPTAGSDVSPPPSAIPNAGPSAVPGALRPPPVAAASAPNVVAPVVTPRVET